jgi:hypothetical protein
MPAVRDREADPAGSLELHARVVEDARAEHRPVGVQELGVAHARIVAVRAAVGLDDGEEGRGGHGVERAV